MRSCMQKWCNAQSNLFRFSIFFATLLFWKHQQFRHLQRYRGIKVSSTCMTVKWRTSGRLHISPEFPFQPGKSVYKFVFLLKNRAQKHLLRRSSFKRVEDILLLNIFLLSNALRNIFRKSRISDPGCLRRNKLSHSKGKGAKLDSNGKIIIFF